ncbi:hypothetical protein A0H81_10533 [Grifola frondosa]|uniref:Uncharacterized protein n=1 Tax=Grifola frondosa TaxID=5627 RepID=A0A1C7LZ30_GRIFR|nr:hypothetical protein A0H81_10533 [Grifola frondosa]
MAELVGTPRDFEAPVEWNSKLQDMHASVLIFLSEAIKLALYVRLPHPLLNPTLRACFPPARMCRLIVEHVLGLLLQ